VNFRIALFFCLASFSKAQLAEISGVVFDPSGGATAKAELSLRNEKTAFLAKAASQEDGRFRFLGLPPGEYVLDVNRDGFQPWRSSAISAFVAGRISIEVKLQLAQSGTAVTVDAPATDQLTAVSTVVDRNFVGNLPLNGRTFQNLIVLTPGAVAAPASFETQGQFSVNGQRTSSNYFTVDGVSANFSMSSAVRPGQTAAGALPALSVSGSTSSLVSVDAMQEFRIQTSGYAAEFGRQPGAQVQIATRSGSNQWNGSLFEFFRNDKFDANDWFANRNRLARPALRQNNFGGVLGGPIRKNQSFFFVSHESLLLRQPRTASVSVPNNEIRSRVPAALKPFVDAIALPNGAELAGGLALFNASYSDPTSMHATSLRLDHGFRSGWQIFGRFNQSPSQLKTRQTAGFAPNTIQSDESRIRTLTLSATGSLSPRLSLESRFNWSTMEAATSQSVDGFGGARPVDASLLYPSFTNRNESAFFFQMTQGVGFVDGNISRNRQTQFNWIESLVWSRGRHQIKTGLDIRWMLPSVFTRDFDVFYRFANPAQLTTGVAATAGVRAFPVVDFRFTNYSAYVQDSIRLGSSLLIDLGLRWEMNPGPTGRNDFALYPIAGNFPTFSIAPANSQFYATRKNNFAPRVGLAWQLRSKLTARSGFGMFHDLGAGLVGSLSDNLYQRERSSANVTFPLPQSALVRVPFPANPPYTIVTGADPNLRLPFSLHWNFQLEQELHAGESLSVAYLGSNGRRLLQTQFYLNPSPQFQQLRYIRNNASSSYNSLQLRYQRKLMHSLQALVSYAWAHSIDSTSGDDTVFSPPQILNSNVDRGSSDFDVRHTFSSAFTWQPTAKIANPILSPLLSGWAVDSIVRRQGALPVTPFETRVFPTLSGSIRTRPDLVPGVPLYIEAETLAGGRSLNPAAFRRITEARQGNLGRNVLRAYSLAQVDLALRRTFSLQERLLLEARAEAYNLFNHPAFAAPVLDVANPLFGQSTQMYGRGLGSGGINAGLNPLYQSGGPRSFQLSLKLRF
jgi:hypothetical protein